MVKKITIFALVLAVVVSVVLPLAMAAEEGAAVDKTANLKYYYITAFASAFGIAIAAFGGALGQGRGISSAVEGIARNPGAGGQIQTAMIIGLALIESLVIYTLVTVLILLFVNPFGL
jgi:F-type H+-transporting ATPase subunit c